MSTPTAASRPRKLLPRWRLSQEKGEEILGLALLASMVLLAASLFSYHPSDASFVHQAAVSDGTTRNVIGPVGAQIAALLFVFLGLSSLLLPLALGAAAWRRLRRKPPAAVTGRGFGVVLVLAVVPALVDLTLDEVTWRGEPLAAGGVLGSALADLLSSRLNAIGAAVVLIAILAIGVSLALRSTLGDAVADWRAHGATLWERWVLARAQRGKRRAEKSARRRVIRHVERRAEARHAGAAVAGRGGAKAAATVRGESEPRIDLPLHGEAPPMRVQPKAGEGQFKVRKVKSARASTPPPAPPAQKDLGFRADEMSGGKLPPVNLLKTEKPRAEHDEAELVRLGEVIRTSASEFGVDGTIEGISPGPVITVYEVQPAPGVKVSKVVNLQDDLALALKAESVRIDRIPGRSTLGMEVPNRKRSIIHLGSLLADPRFKKARSPLTMAIGVDIHGQPHYADLATMPHLLVAGATGAGKSVGLQTMITSILYKATRDQVQFIFIDPKRIELGVYADIPHLKTEVVVEPKKAANALRWAVSEMERRYRLLAELHVRSIDYYNRAIGDPELRKRLALREDASELTADDLKPLPYYVIIIDELADLMMVSAADVETSIARLAQMARAVGIHLIVATQRPSVDVLTGTIKANFPCRLAYATATRHDSRTILDQIGAEKLLGKGDALFMPPGTSRIARLHGAYISEQETAGLIRWLKRRGRPELDPAVVADPVGDVEKGSGGGGDDDLFDEAARLVVAERMGSASFLQRRLRVGFSRAARLIDLLEADGLLGPPQGSKPREVLVPVDYFEEVDRARSEG